MTADQSALDFVANLLLFGCFLLYWVRLLRPNRVSNTMLLGNLLLSVIWQGLALLWSMARLQPFALASSRLGSMFLVETTVLVYLFLELSLGQRGLGTFVLTLAFVIHSYVILLVPLPENLYIAPSLQSPWYLFQLLTALVAYGACVCAGGGAIGYVVSRRLARTRLAPRLPSWLDCQTFTRRSLVVGFPWLSASVLAGAFWAQSAWGRYWPWRLDHVWLLIVWLVLTTALHARAVPSWRGRPLVLLSLLGLASALISLPLLLEGYGPGL